MPLKSWADLLEDSQKSDTVAYEPLPDGTYDFRIEKAEHRVSAKQKDGYNITTVVESGPYEKRKVFDTFWISPDSPAALGIFFRQMKAIGLDNAFWAGNPTKEQIVAALTGKRFRATTTIETYQGKRNNRFSGIAEAGPLPLGGGDVPSFGDVSDSPTVSSGPVVEDSPTVSSAPVEDAKTEASPWDSASGSSVPSFGGAPESPF